VLLLFDYFMARQPLVGPVLVNVEVSRSHLDTQHCTTPLDERSARCRQLYLTTHDTHKRLTSMSPAGFEPTIPASSWLQTHSFDRTTTRIGFSRLNEVRISYSDTNLVHYSLKMGHRTVKSHSTYSCVYSLNRFHT